MSEPIASANGLRLSLHAASREFDTPRETLRRRLFASKTMPGADNKFSIFQVYQALRTHLSSKYSEDRLRLVREQADRIALENAATRSETMTTSFVYKGL